MGRNQLQSSHLPAFYTRYFDERLLIFNLIVSNEGFRFIVFYPLFCYKRSISEMLQFFK